MPSVEGGVERGRAAVLEQRRGLAGPHRDDVGTPLRARGVQDRAEQVALVGVGLDRSGGGELVDELVGDAACEAAAEGAGERRVPRAAAEQLGLVLGRSLPDSSVARNAVPICTPSAPSASAATIPLASAMPPAAMTGARTSSTAIRTSGSVPTSESSACARKAPR